MTFNIRGEVSNSGFLLNNIEVVCNVIMCLQYITICAITLTLYEQAYEPIAVRTFPRRLDHRVLQT